MNARVILHLDMDAFFASVEQRDQPSLRGRPVIVGGSPSQRGVVCAASYEARRFGVRSAIPSATAVRLCPNGVLVRPRMDAYREESHRIMNLISQTGALIEPVSIDEAYLDASQLIQGDDPDDRLLQAVPLAKHLKATICTERGLTASIGIAANKFLAKIGSDFSKPDGLTLVPERDKILFLRPLSVRVIHGVGKVTGEALERAGIRTVGDLQDFPGDLRSMVGSFGHRLRNFAFGRDDRPIESNDEVKSISAEETFARDTEDRQVLRRFLREAAAEIAAKLDRRRLAAKSVNVKVRYGDFTTLTRQLTVQDPLTEAAEIYRLGCVLLGRERLVSRPLRLLGLGVGALGDRSSRQLEFPWSHS